MPTASSPASVIIPTRNRADSLERCLETLSQDRSVTPAEVVVVDNGSTDRTAQVVAAAARSCPRPLRLVREPKAGISHARNTGIRVTRGELLLYLDDDVLVHDGWIDAMVGGFEPEVLAVGGRLIPTFPAGRPVWASDERNFLTFNDDGEEEFVMDGDTLPNGANMGFRRSAIPDPDEPFKLELGSAEQLPVGGQDLYLMWQIQRRGKVVYVPDAVVEHPFEDPARLSLEFARRRSYLAGLGNVRLHRLMNLPRRAPNSRVGLVSAALRATRYLVTVRLRNSRGTPDAGALREEFAAYLALGRYLELLHPRVAAAVAQLLS